MHCTNSATHSTLPLTAFPAVPLLRMSAEQLEKMQQEQYALEQEVMELEKAEPTKNAADKILSYFENKVDPISNPAENEWIDNAPNPGGC